MSSPSAAASRSVVADSRSRDRETSSWRPGSSTGARPSFTRRTVSGLMSMPSTSLPLPARTAASGAPSFPSPTTETRTAQAASAVISRCQPNARSNLRKSRSGIQRKYGSFTYRYST